MSEREALARVAGLVEPGAVLASHEVLLGGVSAAVTAITLQRPDGSRRELVVRQHGGAAFKEQEADVTSMEYRLLRHLSAAGVAVPAPCLLDVSGEVLPGPYFVMERITGTTEISDAALPEALPRMARFLAALHTMPVDGLPPLPPREEPVPGILEHLPPLEQGDAVRARLLELGALGEQPVSLLHGDYWVGNIIWRDGEVAAVIDWEDAALGDALSDLACARVELMWRFGPEAMRDFTEHYLAATPIPITMLPLWELYVASTAGATMGQWGLPEAVEAQMRARNLAFLTRAAADFLSQ